MSGSLFSAGEAAAILFGGFFLRWRCACRSPWRWVSPACRSLSSSPGSAR